MPQRLNLDDTGFDAQLDALLEASRETLENVDDAVQEIIASVRERGDDALAAFTLRFDRFDVAGKFRVPAAELAAAQSSISNETMAALELAHQRIKDFHSRQLPADDFYTDELGVELGSRWTPLESVGLYVPGGLAAYPSSVLMNATPAKIAGVERLVMVVPTPDGIDNNLVFAAAHLAGVDEVYRVGGAQAIAALAYGTSTIAPVSKIVGPGNAYVASAKRHVFGTVGIDMIAGPSEVLIIADETANAEWVAADLLAQAEHDVAARSILITTNVLLAEAVEGEVRRQVKLLPRQEIAEKSWQGNGVVMIAPTLEDSADVANQLAAEHVQICTADPKALLPLIKNAGAIFLGHYTPEAVGDYIGGTNHVLPTSRAARFSSGLSVLDFVKRTSVLGCSKSALEALGPSAVTLADEEGLQAHGRSITARISQRVS